MLKVDGVRHESRLSPAAKKIMILHAANVHSRGVVQYFTLSLTHVLYLSLLTIAPCSK